MRELKGPTCTVGARISVEHYARLKALVDGEGGPTTMSAAIAETSIAGMDAADRMEAARGPAMERADATAAEVKTAIAAEGLQAWMDRYAEGPEQVRAVLSMLRPPDEQTTLRHYP